MTTKEILLSLDRVSFKQVIDLDSEDFDLT